MTGTSSLIGRTLAVLAALPSPYVRPVASDTPVDLGVGESRFELPDAVRALCSHAVAELPRIGYSDPQGEQALRDTYLLHLDRQAADGRSGQPGEVLVTAGGKEAAWLAISYALATRDAGCALVPRPGWEPYGIWLRAARCAYVTYDPAALATEPELLSRIVRGAQVRPKLLVLNYPNNPTGVCVTQARMDAIVGQADRLGLSVVSDEVYRSFDPQGVTAGRAPAFDPARDLLVDSCSKWLGAAGLRVGFLVTGAEQIRDIVRFRATYASCTSLVTQRLAAALLGSAATAAWLAGVRAETTRNRTALALELTARGITVESHGNLYLWCRLPQPDAPKASVDLPSTRSAQVTYGIGFGSAAHFRLCVARPGLDPVEAASAVLSTVRGH
ncbi:pyridoxal phosphate-dependent aminotransferase [Streptomyces sp. NPDC054949]